MTTIKSLTTDSQHILNHYKKQNLIFSEKNYHVYVADITIDELKCVGFEVLKVIIPELHPLYLDERATISYLVYTVG